MPITVYCKKCGRKINAPDHTAGKQGKCPDCGVTVDVPMHNEEQPIALSVAADTAKAPAGAASLQTTAPASSADEAMKKAKEATGNAWQALKILLSDPMGGQTQAVSTLGGARTFQAGIVFCVLFVVAAFLLSDSMTIAPLRRFAESIDKSVKVEVYVRLLLSCIVPAAALLLGFLVVGKLFGGTANMQTSTFATGVALLPTSAALLLAFIVGVGNMELIMLAAFFAVTTLVLLLYAALVDLQKLSTQKSFVLAPALILASAYIAKVFFVSLTGKN